MKLRVFHSADGDCLMLTSSDGHHALIDGGRGTTFEEAAWPTLQRMASKGEEIDLVVVSHIDADHISGIIRLLQWVVDWVVFDFQQASGNTAIDPPSVDEPPTIHKIWHNSWSDQVRDLAGPIQALTSQVSEAIDEGAFDPDATPPEAAAAVDAIYDLAQSIADGVELRRLVDEDTPIPRNPGFKTPKNMVLLQDPPHVEKLGKTRLTVLGPSGKHLAKLRDEWRKWLDVPRASDDGIDTQLLGDLRRVRGDRPANDQHARDVLDLGSRQLADAQALARLRGQQIVHDLATAAARTITKADAKKVTPPNRASITVLAEEAGSSCLLTGDAHEEEILEGLDAAGKLDNGTFECDIVKVQHHGSEHNLSTTFAAKVIGKHYVFCADGAHANPDKSVVKTVIESRLEHPGSFTVWFNCSPERTRANRRAALRAAIDQAEGAARKNRRVKVKILGEKRSYFDIEV